MWFYSFLLFTVAVATFCSVTATIKLRREHHILINKFTTIADDSTVSVSKRNVEDCIKSQSNIFLRVVSRCAIYPLGNNTIHKRKLSAFVIYS
jgi:hypothetical protein